MVQSRNGAWVDAAAGAASLASLTAFLARLPHAHKVRKVYKSCPLLGANRVILFERHLCAMQFFLSKRLTTICTKKLTRFSLPHAHKVMVAGNHDHVLEAMGRPAVRRALAAAGVHYLLNDTAHVAGVGIFGSPASESLHTRNRAFQVNTHDVLVTR